MDTNFLEYIPLLKEIMKSAGKEVLRIYGGGFGVKFKSGKSPVTDADLTAQEIIITRLKSFGYAVLSEETHDDLGRLNQEKIWILDPLDGTKDFIEHTGDFSLMIGLVEKAKPVLGVIYKPIGDKFYFAAKNSGAFLEMGVRKIKLAVSKKSDPAKSRMLISRHHALPKELQLAEKLKIKNISKIGSAGIKAGLLCEGKAELYLNAGDTAGEWDTCAASIILEESGGRITDMNGNNLGYNTHHARHINGFVMSNGLIHDIAVQKLSHLC